MQVSSISSYANNHIFTPQSAFTGQIRVVKDDDGKILYKTNTCFFRRDIRWDDFVKLLDKKYQSVDKVNIFCYGCSSGEEPYSLAIKLQENLGKRSEKFFPIIAKDIDRLNISMAQIGNLEVFGEGEMIRINEHSNYHTDKYFDISMSKGYSFETVVRPKKELREKVEFSVGNIMDDIEKMPKSNTVLMCRNFWKYLSEEDRVLLADKIARHFDETCLVVTGESDFEDADIYKLFWSRGFTSVQGNVFEKVKRIWS